MTEQGHPEDNNDHKSDAGSGHPGAENAAAASDGEQKKNGLGKDGTIPDHPSGVGVGHTGEASTFEPEEEDD